MKNCRLRDAYSAAHSLPFHPEFLTRFLKKRCLEKMSNHASGILIDIGCGKMPYSHIFASRVDRYIGMDCPRAASVSWTLKGSLEMQVIGRAEALPLRCESADTCLLLDVLEHTADYGKVLEEAHACLKKSGKLILTTPFLYPLHMEPLDFYRYTRHGLEHIGRRHGFVIKQISNYGGFWHALGLLFNNYLFFDGVGLNRLVKRETSCILRCGLALLLPLFLAMFAVTNLGSIVLGALSRSRKYPVGYVAVLEKQ